MGQGLSTNVAVPLAQQAQNRRPKHVIFLPVLSLLETRVLVRRNRMPVQKTDRTPLTGSQRLSDASSLHICVCENRKCC